MSSDTTKIAIENKRKGTTDWQLKNPSSRREIEGYASLSSVTAGEEIHFFVHTEAPQYTISIYRMGWYGGLGGRTVYGPITRKGIQQQMPRAHSETGLIACQWTDPYRLKIPKEWLTGVYVAKLQEETQKKESYIIFVVKDMSCEATILFQLPVNTYQAYNFWGGKSLYDWGSGSWEKWGQQTGKRAIEVSFDRPYAANNDPKAAYGVGAGEFFTNIQPVTSHFYPISSAAWDYNMVRWLEKNNYNLSYCTNLDTHSHPELLLKQTLFIAHGHDEYWSMEMRENLEQARNSGVNLAFFAGNTGFWQIRLAFSEKDNKEPRTIICYKDRTDPIQGKKLTINFREPPVNKPESALLGVEHSIDPVDGDIVVTHPEHWVFKGTHLKKGDRIKGVLGYEVDHVTEQSPKNITVLADSMATNLLYNNYGYAIKQLLQKICRRLYFPRDWVAKKSGSFLILFLIGVILFNFLLFAVAGKTLWSLFGILQLLGVSLFLFILWRMVLRQNRKIVTTSYSQMTIYRTPSNSTVFANGTIQWSWGLDDFNAPQLRSARKNKVAEIITRNILDTLGTRTTQKK